MSMLMKKLSSALAASLCATLMLSATIGPVDLLAPQASIVPVAVASV